MSGADSYLACSEGQQRREQYFCPRRPRMGAWQ